MEKSVQEKKLLQEKIQALKEEISTEQKERQELEARLRLLGEAGTRAQEQEEVYQKLYAPKLVQFEKMMAKMSSLKDKLEAAK